MCFFSSMEEKNGSKNKTVSCLREVSDNQPRFCMLIFRSSRTFKNDRDNLFSITHSNYI